MTKRACGFVIFRRIRGTIEYLLMQTSYGQHHWTPPKVSDLTLPAQGTAKSFPTLHRRGHLRDSTVDSTVYTQRFLELVLRKKARETIVPILLYALNSGHVDPGESDMQTALRETEEEAGLSASDLKIFENVKRELRYEVNGKPKIVIYWLAELLNSGKPIRLSDEHQMFKWLPIEEACTVANYQEMRDALNYFNTYILTNLSQ